MHSENLLSFLLGETVMIKYDKFNHNYNKKMHLAPYLNKLYVGVLLAVTLGSGSGRHKKSFVVT